MAAALIITTVLVLAIYHKAVFFSGLFGSYSIGLSDITLMYYPFRDFFSHSIINGRFPLWATYIFYGFPLHAEGQGGFLYPPNLIFTFFPPQVAYNCVFIFHIFLASIFSYLLAKVMGLKKSGALLFSIIFAFSGFFAVHNEHMNLLNAAVWAPLVLLFSANMVNVKSIALLGLVFSAQFLAGFPQMAYYSAIFGFIWLLVINKGVRQAAIYILAGILGVFISAAQVIPTLELIPYSARAQGMPGQEMYSWGYYLKDLLIFLKPYIYGNPAVCTYTRSDSLFGENCAYMGLMVLVFFFFGAYKRFSERKIKAAVMLAAAVIIFILLFYAVRDIFIFIPGMKFFRLPQRLLLFVVIMVAYVAAAGFERIKKYRVPVFLIVAAELANFSCGYNKIVDSEYLSKPDIAKRITADKSLFRVYTVDEGMQARMHLHLANASLENQLPAHLMYRNYLPANINMVYGIQSLGAYSPLAPRIDTQYNNIRYIITSSEKMNGSERLFLVGKMDFGGILPRLSLYEKKVYYPRVFIKKSDESIVALDVIEYSSIAVKIANSEKIKGVLCLCDWHYPGWKVFVDGSERKIENIQSVRWVDTRDGAEKINFIYSPASFRFGIIVSVVFLFLAGMVLFGFGRGNENTGY